MEVNQSNIEFGCAEARKLISTSGVYGIHVSVVVLQLAGFPLVLHVGRLFIPNGTFHVNTKILFTTMIISLALRAALMTYRSVKIAMVGWFASNDCQLVYPLSECLIQSTLGTFFIATLVCSHLSIVVERLIATMCFRVYHKSDKPFIGILLCTATFGYPVYVLAVTLPMAGGSSKSVYITYCSSKLITSADMNYWSFLGAQFYIPMSCAVVSVILYVVVRTKQRTYFRYNIEHRFTLDAVLRSTRIILPSSIMFVFLFVGSANLYYFMLLADSTKSLSYSLFAKELNSLIIIPIYIHVFPWICILRNRQFMRRTFVCATCKLHRVKPIIIVNKDHFVILKQYW